MNNLVATLRVNAAEMNRNEEGAESVEVIIFLVIFVLGLVGTWMFIRNKTADQGSRIGECIAGAEGQDNC
jgi:hypothetical protein